MSQVELAYIAGLFDGEGCLHYSFKHHWYGRKENSEYWIQITNINRPIIEYLHNVFGGGMVLDRRQGGNRRMNFAWKIVARGTFRVLRQIAPYLRIKREQVNMLLDHETLISKHGQRPEAEKVILRELTKRNQVFNRRGKEQQHYRNWKKE